MATFSHPLIVGGGLVGLGTAWQLLRSGRVKQLTLLEKEARVGAHQSTHNSGVLHAGLYYKPGSLKARLAVEGIREMSAYCREKKIPHEICGKVVVAVDESKFPACASWNPEGRPMVFKACDGSTAMACVRSSPTPPGWRLCMCRRRELSITRPFADR